MLFSLIETYAPHLNLSYCEPAFILESIITLLVCEHVYSLTITRDDVTIMICP